MDEWTYGVYAQIQANPTAELRQHWNQWFTRRDVEKCVSFFAPSHRVVNTQDVACKADTIWAGVEECAGEVPGMLPGVLLGGGS